MKNDPHYGGMRAYTEIKESLLASQRKLCAYCEIDLPDLPDKQRVEHYHSKKDDSRNWALEWNNLWLVCLGGSFRPIAGESEASRYYLEPVKENLSCDAFKDQQIEDGALSVHHEGVLLNPGQVPSFPRLFRYNPTGFIEPDAVQCQTIDLEPNQLNSTAELVESTITHLNLNCVRLREARRIALAQLEKRIEIARKATPQRSITDILAGLFRRGSNNPWPAFFTLLRFRLDKPAEEFLRSIDYDG